MYDALVDHPSARIVNHRHETSAVFAAMGHRRSGGSLPCVLVTSGPGMTNAITGLAAAYADGVPLLVIAGEVPRRTFGRGALQEGSHYGLDILSMARSVTKLAAEVTHARLTSALIQKAIDTALAGRQGPVLLSLPLDVACERTPVAAVSAAAQSEIEPDSRAVERCAAALAAADRGLILVGSGARDPAAIRAIATIAEALQIPVATTPKAKGLFPESHPLSLGIFGLAGHPSATAYLERGVDTLLCIGCGMGETATNGWSPLLSASRAFIQIDIDPTQIGKNYAVDVALVSPAHVALEAIAARLGPARAVRKTFGVTYDDPLATLDASAPLKPPYVLRRLQEIFPPDTIFTVDIGEHALFAMHYLRTDDPRSFIMATGLGSMGSGIGAAVGAKLVHPDRPVVSIAGDYGFQMCGMELATCVEQRIGAVFVVFNDSRMRMVEAGMQRLYERHPCLHSPPIDFAALARSLGAEGYSIRSAEDFEQLPADFARRDRPVVLDIAVDPNAVFSSNGRVAHLRNFKG
ncbi:Acetolactate synthase large subunit protein [Minicystis rosea]|nr:Acetolactate synthase large subunit protein [Minicystis rosea]